MKEYAVIRRRIELADDVCDLMIREMARGGYASEDELLRIALEHWAEHRESLAELDAALDQADAGQTRTWDDFRRRFRAEHSLPPPAP